MSYTPVVSRPNDLGVNTYSPAGNGVGSSVEMYTLYDRDPAEQIWTFRTHVGYAGFSTWLRAMGFGMGHQFPTTGHYEVPWNQDPVKVGSIVTAASGAGNDIVIALHADSMYDTQVTTGGAARKASYPVVGDIIETYSRKQFRVKAKNVTTDPHRLTLTPLDSTVDPDAHVLANESYGIPYNLWSEGSKLPNGRAPRIFKYTNGFGIVKHSFGSTGNNLVDVVRFETIPGQPGSAGDSIYAMIQAEEMERFERSRSGLLLFGQTADNLTETDTFQGLDTPINGTEGFVDFAYSYGTPDSYTAGAYAIDDFDAIGNVLRDERAATAPDIMLLDGPDISLETENLFVQTLSNDLTPFVDRIVPGYAQYESYQRSIGMGPNDATLAFNFKAIQKNGFIFHMIRVDEFADIRVLGGADYGYRTNRIAVPVGWTRDAITGTNRPTIGYEWRQNRNYSREIVFGDLPGAGVGGNNTPFGKAVTEYDGMKYFLMSELAGHFACANAIVVQTAS